MSGHRAEPVPCPVGWVTTVRVTLSRLALAVLAGLAVWPLIFSMLGFTVGAIESGSMMPTLRVGDVVASAPMDIADVRTGQIVTVVDPATDDGGLLTHRVHAIADDGALITKGDANADPDSTPVTDGDVTMGRLRVPFVGYPVVWWTSAQWLPLAGTAVGLVLLARGSSEQPLALATGEQSRRRAGALATAATAAVVVVLVAQSATPSSAAFSATTAAATSTWSVAAARLGPYGDAVLADRPFLFFRMDEQSGDVAVDSSGNGHDSGYRGSPIKAGVVGALPGQTAVNSATELDGAAAIASTRTYAETTDFTFEAFLMSRGWWDSGPASTIAELRTPDGFRDRLYLSYGSLLYQADQDTAPVHLQGYLPTDGSWHYVAMSMSGTSMNVHLDRQVWHVEVPDRDPAVNARFVIGTHLQPFDDPTTLGTDNYLGVIDEVALYTYALTEEQVARHVAAAGIP
ncbi:signal peptidase I [Cellulomonas sp. Leaf334]|uniref:signal peptidase I n=1 Tax=Cellulomonas sp. Leaf334 TaxID=1736339 RepID=UPI0007023028|nr:signal peptidase I [Cellulomonas sp. Leaf334]KQR16787.1 hypothetical protein ASF78_05405 [Cellulomonas sp. Leaf334]